jgi:hypothetical protein
MLQTRACPKLLGARQLLQIAHHTNDTSQWYLDHRGQGRSCCRDMQKLKMQQLPAEQQLRRVLGQHAQPSFPVVGG